MLNLKAGAWVGNNTQISFAFFHIVFQADHTDTYRGKYNVDTHPGADFGKLYADDVKAMIDGVRQSGRSIAALFAESIVCCGGQVFLPPGYLREVYKLVCLIYIAVLEIIFVRPLCLCLPVCIS